MTRSIGRIRKLLSLGSGKEELAGEDPEEGEERIARALERALNESGWGIQK